MSGTVPISWKRLQEIVKSENIHELYRSPEGLQTYRNWKAKLQAENIDLAVYLVVNQLGWASPDELDLHGSTINDIHLHPKDMRLFAHPDDIKIIRNDFPYYFEEGMTHLVVWVKTPMDPDPNSPHGDISVHTKNLIEKYVQKTFVDQMGISKSDLVWFKNWAALQSVRAIPHVHVILRNVSEETVNKIVGTSGSPLIENDYKL